MPLRAYAHDQGHRLGHTFLQFTHVGRKSGTEYRAVAMVLGYDDTTGGAVICAAWDTDWYRDLQVQPATNAKLDRLSFAPMQRFLDDDEAFQVVRGDFVLTHPFVAFRPHPAGRASPTVCDQSSRGSISIAGAVSTGLRTFASTAVVEEAQCGGVGSRTRWWVRTAADVEAGCSTQQVRLPRPSAVARATAIDIGDCHEHDQGTG